MTTRQRKTDQQRAEEALGVAQRRVARLEADQLRRRAELTALEAQLADARRRQTYLQQDPALQGSTTSSTTTQKETA